MRRLIIRFCTWVIKLLTEPPLPKTEFLALPYSIQRMLLEEMGKRGLFTEREVNYLETLSRGIPVVPQEIPDNIGVGVDKNPPPKVTWIQHEEGSQYFQLVQKVQDFIDSDNWRELEDPVPSVEFRMPPAGPRAPRLVGSKAKEQAAEVSHTKRAHKFRTIDKADYPPDKSEDSLAKYVGKGPPAITPSLDEIEDLAEALDKGAVI